MSLENFLPEMERCSLCSFCKWIPHDKIESIRFAYACPSISYNNLNSYSARGKYAMGKSLITGKAECTDIVVDSVFKCQTCGACDVSCKVCRYNLEPLQMMFALREKLVKDGKALPEHKKYIDSLNKENNMRLGSKSERGKWADGLKVKNIGKESAAVLFHAGCRFSYDKELQEVAKSAVTVLQKAGVDVGIFGGEEMCCGAKAQQMGFTDEFNTAAKKVIEKLKGAGVKKIVTSCANCFFSFTRLYPKLGAEFEVLHTAQYLDQLIKEGKIKFSGKVPLRVTYHDPCRLGRQGEPYVAWNGKEKKVRNQIITYDPPKPRYNGAKGVYDAPRDVLKSIPGIELVEMERKREYAWCCGSGGGAREVYPEYSQWTATERIEEAKTTGADAIVTACGSCERNFIDAASAAKEKIKVFDIVQIVQQAMA